MRTSIPALGVTCLLGLAACPEDASPPLPAPPVKKTSPDARDAARGTAEGLMADGGAADGGAADGGVATLDAFVEVNTKPTGAVLTLDGQSAGTSPAKLSVASGKKSVLQVSMPGFFPETKELEPAPGETVTASFILKPAVVLHVTSDPPDASVTVNGALALAATPGDALVPPGTIEVAVSLPRHDTFRKKLKVKTGEQKLDVKLAPSVRVSITSRPSDADVTVDGKPSGKTPLDLWLSAKGRYVVAVSKAGFSTVKKVIARPQPDDDPVEFTLTDLELEKLQANVDKKLAAYDRAYEALERAQQRVAQNPALSEQLDAAEAAMQKATDELEEAKRQLEAAQKARGLH